MGSPAPLDALLGRLRADPAFVRNVTAWRTLAACPANVGEWPELLLPQLKRVAQHLGVRCLYTHQEEAVRTVLAGQNVVLATGTASGKTLGYVLPVLNALLQDPRATALFLYPTKALAHDQLDMLERWGPHLPGGLSVRTYDGDTPQRYRAAVRKEARVLITNPDMLHLGILPHHTQWMRFFSGLRYVVLDELHTYRGVFGSHVANILRRLKRIAGFYGASPLLIAASATIANPQALAEALWEAPVILIQQDGAPYGRRHVIFYNPPLRNPTLGLRASAGDEALALALRLLQAGVQTIVFARSRLTVELLLRELRLRMGTLGLEAEAIQGYRGGYLPSERRAIEQGLREGRIRLVVATNALELGIDIGALDAAVLVGYPGSIAATRQQMGRAGRRGASSMAVFIATMDPLDQYLVMHPEYFFGRSPEAARVNPDTLSLLASHLSCAAFELPLQAGERFGQARGVTQVLEALASAGVLHQGGSRFSWIGETYPAVAVSLRSATPDHVIVQAEGQGVIGTVDRPSAPRLVHEGAIYFHRASPYLIEKLDWEQGLAYARQAPEIDYYTVASATTQVKRLALRRRVPTEGYARGVALSEEEILVRSRPVAYRRIHLATHETLGWGEIELPEQEMETEGFRVTLGPALVELLAEEGVPVAPLDYGPDWPQVREQILARDGHRCRLCGRKESPERPLEVHHVTPLRVFLSQYTRSVALRLAHAPENLLTLCPLCHRQVERARGARTALSGLAYLLRHLAPVFLMCDSADLGTAVEARDVETGQPAVILYDAVPGGVGLTSQLISLWPDLAQAALERVSGCPCRDGCPSCVGPVGESEEGAKRAARRLLQALGSSGEGLLHGPQEIHRLG